MRSLHAWINWKPLGSVTARCSKIHKNWYGHDHHASHTFAVSLGHTGISDTLLYDISLCLYVVAKQNIDIGALKILQPCLK